MDIAGWLRGLGLERYIEAFAENDIDGDLLRNLTDADLRELGVASLGHRKKLLKAIAALDTTPAPAPAPSGRAERRQLTVMFVDLVGSTALASRLDPEEMGALLKAYQNAVTGEISRLEGHVAKLMGDGVLAFFGWPRAHEDEAERAVKAGLAVRHAVAAMRAPDGAPLACRVGIATGPVVVGDLVGEGAAREEAVIGETPNLAARLQALAEPGQVVIAEPTRRLVGDMFELSDLGPQALKGFAAPVPAFAARAERVLESRFAAHRGAGLTPLVGREQELALLLDRWQQAKDGDGQVVLLTGEAGIGKSRLVQALRERLADEPHAAICYQCSPQSTQTALFPVRTRLEQAAGFERRDSATTKLGKLEALVSREMGESAAFVPLLAALADVPTGERYAPLSLTPQQQKLKTFAALTAHLERTAAGRPVLLVFEDLHWIDPTSRELMEGIIDRLQSLPALAILTTRPGLEPPWMGRPHVTVLALSALSHPQVAALAGHAAGGKGLPPELLEQIVGRTDGVPFFVEELTRSVVEAGLLQEAGDRYVLRKPLQPVAIPETLQDSLMARLDRLGSVKEVAQVAACLGREFSRDHLATVLHIRQDDLSNSLTRLMQSELILEQGLAPAEMFSFRHVLVQEAAYASLLKSRRERLHGRIAGVIEEQYPEMAETRPEWLARHFSEAHLAEPATRYWLEAARRAKNAFANREAEAHLRRCLDVIASASVTDGAADPTLGRRKLEALVLMGDIASVSANLHEANRCYDLALGSASEPGDRARIANKRHRARVVVREGARIAFYEHGGGSPTLVLVTPIAYSLGAWQPLIDRLCQEFRVVTVDARGSGASDPLVRPYPITEHIRDVRAVIATLGDGPFIGIGLSRGANMLLHLAHAEPCLFEKLLLLGGAPTAPEPPYFPASYVQGCREALERGDVEGLLRFHTAHVLSELEMIELRELVVRARLLLPPETLLSFWDPDPTIDVTPILPAVIVPTLVAHGREDRLVLFRAAEALVDLLPNAQLYAFEGKGHFPIFTATDEFCDVLRRFVRTGTVAKRLLGSP